MALCLVGKAGRGLIWAGFPPVMSQEAPIPLAPCSEAAQSNHANPTNQSTLLKILPLTSSMSSPRFVSYDVSLTTSGGSLVVDV